MQRNKRQRADTESPSNIGVPQENSPVFYEPSVQQKSVAGKLYASIGSVLDGKAVRDTLDHSEYSDDVECPLQIIRDSNAKLAANIRPNPWTLPIIGVKLSTKCSLTAWIGGGIIRARESFEWMWCRSDERRYFLVTR